MGPKVSSHTITEHHTSEWLHEKWDKFFVATAQTLVLPKLANGYIALQGTVDLINEFVRELENRNMCHLNSEM